MSNNIYASWTDNEKFKEKLVKINKESRITKSGIPLMYDDKFLYIDESDVQTMVIGSTGSGKTQSVALPLIETSLMADDSVLINDPMGEIYRRFAYRYKEKGYNVITLDFKDDLKGNSWNPLLLAYELYQNDKKDECLVILEEIGSNLFNEKGSKESDPFWINTTMDFFCGCSLYLFEKAPKESINLNSVYNISSSIASKDFINELKGYSKNSAIYMNLASTVMAPAETKGSILSVFNQLMKKYVSRDSISQILSVSDFDIKKVGNEKTIIFIIGGNTSITNNLIPLFINQVYYCIDKYGNHEKYFNILLDEFDNLIPFKSINKLLSYGRSIKVRFTLFIQSLITLTNLYGKEDVELLKINIGNMIYLFANDLETINYISDLCGNRDSENKLITINELKTLDRFESIMIIPRMMPIKTKILPYYEYNIESKETNIVDRCERLVSIYSINEK